MQPHEKIRQARKELGLNQIELARVLSVSQNDISKIENGGKKFIPNSYIYFLKSNGYDINTLFDDKIPLQKTSQNVNSAHEDGIIYESPIDKKLINRVMSHFGFEDIEQLNDYLKRYDELEKDRLRLEQIELLYAKTILEFGQFKDDTTKQFKLLAQELNKLKTTQSEVVDLLNR